MQKIKDILQKPLTGWQKALICVLMAAYFISPIDFVPDVTPVLGQIDDVLVIVLGLTKLISAKKSIE